MLSIVGLFSGCDRPDRYSLYVHKMAAGTYVIDSKTGKVYILNSGEVVVWDPVSNELVVQMVNETDKTKED